jgi:hypothetical protein
MDHTINRYIPENSTLVDAMGTDAAVYTYERNGNLCAVAFHGKAGKSDWRHRFPNNEQRDKKIASFIDGRKIRAEAMAERRALQKAPHTMQIGDILYSSWGYDQTNIDYYEVVGVTKKCVKIRSIESDIFGRDEWGQSGKCRPAPGKFKGQIQNKLVQNVEDRVYLKIASYAFAYPCEADASHNWDSSH